MPDWQRELEALLLQLHVSLDSANPSDDVRNDQHTAWPGTAANDGSSAHLTKASTPMDHIPAEFDEVSVVQSEIAATVGHVIALAKAGQMDRALRDDVVFVLRALTRPYPKVPRVQGRERGRSEPGKEWQFASEAAVLRFCRIVLRLTPLRGSDAMTQ
jgi:hypothetical protein